MGHFLETELLLFHGILRRSIDEDTCHRLAESCKSLAMIQVVGVSVDIFAFSDDSRIVQRTTRRPSAQRQLVSQDIGPDLMVGGYSNRGQFHCVKSYGSGPGR